jgi:2-oxoglutarate ferredoxin oxidoreductase subunit alpha
MKVMTATAGPGISLYSEQISFAVGSEIPIVIVDVQRLGPSTGSATRGADGDINFLRWGNSGGLPVIVLAPVDVRDCYLLTIEAFNLAERYRCPVFIASNKEVALTRESINLGAIETPKIEDRDLPPTGVPYLPFGVVEGRRVPYFQPIGGDVLARQTSSTHGADGYITTDPDEIAATQTRIKDKLDAAVDGFSYHNAHIQEQAHSLVIAYGVTARAAAEAVQWLQARGDAVSLLVLKTLWPVPAALIRAKSEHASRILVPEMNLGQYVGEIQRILPQKEVLSLNQMDGRLITPQQIVEAVAGG